MGVGIARQAITLGYHAKSGVAFQSAVWWAHDAPPIGREPGNGSSESCRSRDNCRANPCAADAADQVQHAVSSGCDTILACGGDGTINDILQGMVGTNAALGIIPLGTANALGHDLGLPRAAGPAASAALAATPRRIAVGKIEYQHRSGQRSSRYFTVAAGIGVDAHLFYQLNPAMKSRTGMAAYY